MPKTLSKQDMEDFRERLCAVALEQFALHGPDGVSLRSLARELGCSAMTPYRYFPSKDHILAAVRAAAFGRFAHRMNAAIDAAANPLAGLEALATAYVQFALDEPSAYRLMFSLLQPDGSQFPELVEQSRRARETKLRAVQAAIDEGLFEGEALQLANLLWASFHGVVSLHLAGTLPRELEFPELVEEMLRLLLRGLLKTDSSQGLE